MKTEKTADTADPKRQPRPLALVVVRVARLPKSAVVLCIRAYQATGRIRPKVCRYNPSCSEYAAQAVNKYGVYKGVALGIRRILRCSPFTTGGYDPVP